MKNTQKRFVIFCFAWISLTCGCSEKLPDGTPPLHRVTLEFHQEGVPLVEASIHLIPESDATNSWFVGGTTDDNGRVELKTYRGYSGAPVGKYKIIVSKFESEGELPQIGKAPFKTLNLLN